jgi:tripartite-type tricarboxylate transporter receptor subunit TctC
VLGGHIDITPIVTATVMDYLASGKLKALASTAPERNQYLPDVPTFREKGYDVTSIKQFYAFGPPGLPESIKVKIAKTFKEMCQDDRISEDLDKLKLEVSNEESLVAVIIKSPPDE